MYELPKTVKTESGATYHIRKSGDFRMILDCFKALQDTKISEDARILASLIIFYEEFTTIWDIPADQGEVKSLIEQMYKFFNCGKRESVGAQTSTALINWENDSQLICAAVNAVAKMEIRALEYLHWWTFIGDYISVGESVLATVVGIRDKVIKGKKLEKWERDFKRANPEHFIWRQADIESQDIDRMLRNRFHRSGGQ